MNRTTTVVVALIAAAGLSTMVYAVPEQRALAWGGFGGCGFGFGGCGGFFGDGFHKHIIQTISQTNTCSNPSAHTPSPPPPPPPLPSKGDARGGSAGSGGAGGSGGEGGQGGKNVGDSTSTNKANIDQKANGGNSNGGHAGNANGGDVRIYGNGDDQKANSNDGQDQNQAYSNDGQDQRDNQVVCLNTAVNTAGHGFGANGVGQDHVPHVGDEGSENGVGHIIAKQQVIAVSSYGVHSGFGDHGFSHGYSPRYNYGPGYPIFPCGSGPYSTINGQIVCTPA